MMNVDNLVGKSNGDYLGFVLNVGKPSSTKTFTERGKRALECSESRLCAFGRSMYFMWGTAKNCLRFYCIWANRALRAKSLRTAAFIMSQNRSSFGNKAGESRDAFSARGNQNLYL
ncbi:MAG: hypothetical protein ACLUKN_11445 [Bacilli bacterium]